MSAGVPLGFHPVQFGPADRPLVGWLHAAGQRTSTPSAAVVLFNPFGYEELCAHRPIGEFADTAAELGCVALRFAYDGTGDSAGTDLDPRRVEAWVDSGHRAIDFLKSTCGVSTVCLVGFRLGAAIATMVAAGRDDIASLIAVAPVVSGRGYLRELRAFQATMNLAPAPEQERPDFDEAAGFAITAETKEALTAIDLTKLAPTLSCRVLILDRAELAGAAQWAAQLAAAGVDVEHRELSGYAEMGISPHGARTPARFQSAFRDWLLAQARARPGGDPPPGGTLAAGTNARPAVAAPTAAVGADVVEERVRLGADDAIVGVLSRLRIESGGSVTGSRGILLLNAGATYHVGPNRMYVELARRWAAAGATVIRLDLSGLGDSLAHAGEEAGSVYSRTAVADVGIAVDFLRGELGAASVCAVGLCAGAYHGLKATVAGARIDELVMINPLTFFWKEGMSLDAPLPPERVAQEALRYKKTAFRLRTWIRLFRGEVNVRKAATIIVRRALAVSKAQMRELARQLGIPLRDDLAWELRGVADRGTGLRFIFADGDPGLDLLRSQGGRAVGQLQRAGALTIDVVHGSNHTFTASWSRKRLYESLARFVDTSAP